MTAENEPLFRRKLHRVGSDLKDKEFSLVSYNILCDYVFRSGEAKYVYVSEDVKLRGPEPKTSIRHTQLMKELRWLDADILCLQEVDTFYFLHLTQELGSNLGYQGVFKQHKECGHGLATFYKSKKFIMRESNTYSFNKLLGKICDLNQFQDLNKHNERIAQYTTLEETETGKQLVIVNVHLMFGNWSEPDVQSMQAALFFQQLHNILPLCSKHSTAWIMCGDFNMRPYFPGYELMRNGRLTNEACENLNPAICKYPQITKPNEVKKYESVVLEKYKKNLCHPFQNTKSAYKTVLGSEPVFTHYECDELFPELFGVDILKDTLDYIWYSSDTLQVNAVLEMVKEEVIAPLKACPNRFFPSDHLSLKAFFHFF